MKKFKLNDKVKLKETSEFANGANNNPVDTIGTVIEVRDASVFGLQLVVKWNNDYENTYDHKDLYPASESLKVLYMIGYEDEIDNKRVFATEEEAITNSQYIELDSNRSLTKEVDYFNKKLYVPENTKYIAIDHSGQIYAFMEEPFIRSDNSTVWWSDGYWVNVGKVTSTNVDWKKSLRQVA
ncbi:hypothetical protein RGZ1_17 [Morganella phage vB_MmoM_Rgz1]|nr:hypothetical protein RGZ1_17 [Morganella phage vB_MmoM_Rgz1]